jgi:hypothetical protein
LEQTAEKVVSLPRERSSRVLGTDELNICEFPLTSNGRATGKGENTLVFEDEIFDEGTKQPVHRKLIVSASESFGLPTPADSDVLLVLMHLTNLRNGFTDRSVNFTRYELVKFLGWDQSGKSYRRIEEALQRWVNITLNYNRAWWDRDGRRWASKSFHILESVDLRGRGDSRDDGSSSFTWNQVIFGSFEANHVKRLDLDTYFRLKSPAARQAYRFLDKRFYRSKSLDFDLRTFACEHIGLSRTYDNGQLKRKLQPAIEELEAIGFLKPMAGASRYAKRQRGEWIIKLIREGENAAADVAPAAPDPLLEELLARGVHASTAKEILERHTPELIREKIALLDWLVTERKDRAPKNPAGYLAAAIRNDYKPPADFPRRQAAPPVKSRAPAPKAAPPAESPAEDDRLAAARLFFASLSPDEQQRVEEQALARGNRFSVETYRRLKAQGGKLWEQVRDGLIAEALVAEGLLAAAGKR